MRLRALAFSVALAIVALAGSVAAVSVATGGDKSLPPNPDAGLTDQQRHARYSAARDEFQRRLDEWIAALDLSKVDLAALPHTEMMVEQVAPRPSFEAALQAAGRVIVGTVTSLRAATQGTLVTLDISRTLKGAEEPSLTLRQGSGVQPGPGWKEMVIVDAPGDPLLLPGTHVMLLLEDAPDGVPYVRPFSGTYYLDTRGVRALPLNPFGETVNGLSEADLVSRALSLAGN